MSAFEASKGARREAVRYAQAILTRQLSILESCVALTRVADRVVPIPSDDPDFAVFAGVASECDGIPLGEVRQQWKVDALSRMDAEAQRYTDQVRDQVLAACENIVARFGDRQEDQFSGSVV
jgi:hypothetical protein